MEPIKPLFVYQVQTYVLYALSMYIKYENKIKTNYLLTAMIKNTLKKTIDV